MCELTVELGSGLNNRTTPSMTVNNGSAVSSSPWTATVTPATDGWTVTVVYTDSDGADWNDWYNQVSVVADSNATISEPVFTGMSTGTFTVEFTVTSISDNATVTLTYA